MTLRLWLLLKPRLAAEGVATVYETLERPLSTVLARMEMRGIAVDRQILSRLSGDFAQTLAAARGRDLRARRRAVQLGSPKQLGDILFGKMGLPGGRKTATGAWATGANVLEDLAAAGHELPRCIARLAPALQAEVDLHRRAARLHAPGDRPGAHLLSRWPRPRPAGCPRPSRTCRTSRSAPRRAARSARAFIAEPGNKLISADYSQIELRVLAHIADIPQLQPGLRRRLDIHAMTASEMFGVPVERHAARRAPPRQGDQFRHHLRHLGLRPRQPARHRRASEAGAYIKTLLRALPRHPRLHGRDEARAAASTATSRRSSAARATIPDIALVEPVAARLRRARRDQRADPGLGRRHHPPRHDPHGRRAGRGRG